MKAIPAPPTIVQSSWLNFFTSNANAPTPCSRLLEVNHVRNAKKRTQAVLSACVPSDRDPGERSDDRGGDSRRGPGSPPDGGDPALHHPRVVEARERVL